MSPSSAPIRLAAALLVVAGTTAALAATGLAAPHHATTPRVAPACVNGQIVSWLNTAGNGYAGGVGYELQFTNVSTHTCSLTGFPGVSAVNFFGHQIGLAATRSGSAGHAVTIRPGATARAAVLITATGNFPLPTCRPVTADGLLVYAPGQTASDVIPFPFSVCSSHHTGSLAVQTTT